MFAALLALAPFLVRRVLVWLGLGVVAFVGIDAVMDGAISAADDAFSGITGDALQYFLLSGTPEVLKKVLGAYSTVLSMQLFKKIGFLG